MNTFFADARRRTLAILAAAAALALLLAALALHGRNAATSPTDAPHPLLPGFAERLHDVTAIHIESAKHGTVDVAFLPMKGWVLPARDNYPASFDAVRQLLGGLASLETVEPKTARPEWFGFVDLVEPPKGNGARIVVRNAAGLAMADVIVGKTEESLSGGAMLYVRKANENQSWLAKMPAPPPLGLDAWMDRDIVSVDRARIARVEFAPASGPAFTLVRDTPQTPAFRFKALPPGREPALEAIDNAGAGLSAFAFEDVAPRGTFDFSNGARIVTRTFDGLVVAVEAVREGDAVWARLTASAAPGANDAAKEARAINAKVYGWAFRLPEAEASAFTATLESLLAPKK